jgi:hypothetical protein
MITTNSSYYSKRKVEKKRVGSLWKLSEFYIAKFVDSYFHLCEHGCHHYCVDVDALFAGTSNVDDVSVALYLGYYDWGSSHLVVCVSDSDSPYFCTYIFVYDLCRMWHLFYIAILDVNNIWFKH